MIRRFLRAWPPLAKAPSSLAVLAALVTATLVTPACGSQADDEPVVADNVFVLPDDLAKAATVEPGRLSFPLPQADDLRARHAGDVLVSGYADGFLRRVKSIAIRPDAIVFEAPQAELTDAIVNGALDTTLVPAQGALRAQALRPQDFRVEDRADLPTIDVNVDGNVLFEDKGKGLRIALSKASLALHPSIAFGFGIQDGKVTAMHAVANGDFDAHVTVEASVEEALTRTGTTTIWTTPTPLRFVQLVGFVPVVEVVTISVDATYTLEASGKIKASAGASFSRRGSFGVDYAQNKFSVSGEAGDPKITADGPSLEGSATLSAHVELTPRIEVKLYGVAGPTLTAGPSATLSQNVVGSADLASCSLQLPYSLEAAVRAKVGVDAAVFGHTLATFETTIYERTFPITSGDWVDHLDGRNPCKGPSSGGGGGEMADGGAPDGAPPAAVLPGCTGGVFRGRTFSFCAGAVDWTAARAHCTAAGADLAVIHDAQENDFVKAGMATSGPHAGAAGFKPGYYIGLTYDPATKTFRWVDGTAPAYFDWAALEPTHVSQSAVVENCTMAYMDGTWNDVPCGQFPRNAFVCESK
jgi:hypothetical protein